MSPRPSALRPAGSRRIAPVAAIGAVAALLLVAVPVLALKTDPEPDKPCYPGYGTGLLTEYVTTVNTPADSTDWWVSVTFTLVDDGQTEAECELSLSTYEQPDGSDPDFPQTLFDSDGGVFGAGSHTLTAALPREGEQPGCYFQYDFVFGPALDTVNNGDYGDRQIRSRIEGTDDCSIEQETPAPTPTPTPTPSETETERPQATPRESTQAGSGGPRGPLPNTATEEPGSSLAPVLALVALASLGVLGYANLAAVRRQR
jgi:hypothetical protein